MSELISNLNTIESVKLDIKSAIEAKGVSMSGVSFPDYPSAIGSITTSFVTTTLSTSVNGNFTPGQGVDGFSQVVVDVPQSVTGFTEKELTERKINIVNLNNSASFVGGYAFESISTLVTVNLPNCLYIGSQYTTKNSAFARCRSLESVNLPVCSFINDYTFEWCISLSYISLPACQIIGEGAFRNCNSLSLLYLPVCEKIGSGCFSGCNNISVNLPVCSTLGDSCFFGCNNISVNLPVCSTLGKHCFHDCNNIVLTLGSTSVCAYATRMFNGVTGIISVYVPSSLVDAYKSAQSWSAYSSQIFPIPE